MTQTQTALEYRPPVFEPFYERFANVFSRSLFGRLVLPFCLAIACGLLLGDFAYSAGSRTLTFLIAVAMLAVHYATHAIRTCLPYMDQQVLDEGRREHHDKLGALLGNRRFVFAGLLFGVVNALLGYMFGVPAGSQRLYVGFFLVGFVCGMAALGIYGVVVLFGRFAANPGLIIDYASPDGCGGLKFIGDALMRFCAVTLFVGVGVSYYILSTDWSSKSDCVLLIRLMWVGFPYLLAAVVLLSPAFDLSRQVREFKLRKESAMRSELDTLRSRVRELLQSKGSIKDEYETLRSRIEDLTERRQRLHAMRTFPFGIGANLKFGSMLATSFSVTALGIANSAGDFWKRVTEMM